jgi:hypothetical protein
MDLRYGSSGGALTLRVQSPEFKPCTHQEKSVVFFYMIFKNLVIIPYILSFPFYGCLLFAWLCNLFYYWCIIAGLTSHG